MELKQVLIYITILVIGIIVAHQMNVVSSESMEPVLYKGDIVVIDYNPSSVEVGDIVVYKAAWYENKLVIHRVVAKQSSNDTMYYILKGDNNEVQDPYPISRDQIISEVVKVDSQPLVIPKIGYISLLIQEIPKILFMKNSMHNTPPTSIWKTSGKLKVYYKILTNT